MLTQLPKYGLGTAAIDFEAPDADAGAAAMVRAAIDHGMNLIDTSPLYGYGLAEAGLGRALAGVPRDRYFLSTKTGYLMDERSAAAMRTPDPRVKRYPPKDYSYEHTVRSIERSLEVLGVERLDIVFLHDPTREHLEQAAGGAMPALLRFREEGRIGHIGVGLGHVQDALAFVEALDLDVAMIAGRHTLLIRDADELLDRCGERGTPVILAGPLNSGILADPDQPAPRFNYGAASQEWIDRARRMAGVCRRHGVPLKAAALQFPLRDDRIRTVMTGSVTPAELEENAALARLEIPPRLWADLPAEGVLS